MVALILFIILILVAPTVLLLIFRGNIANELLKITRKVDAIDKKLDAFSEKEKEVAEEDDGTLFMKHEQEKEVPKKEKPPVAEPAPKQIEKEATKAPLPTPEQKPKVAAYQAPAVAKPTKKKKDFNFEKFIGENLLNKIGIGVLVLGIAFFVKYAIDQNWINEAGRVAIGLFSGSLLVGLAHRIRKTYKAFSSVLIGGGLATFYFTTAIGFHEYQLFSQTLAFAFMVVITSFSVLLSLVYNRQELAVLAIVGGFATPFICSDGSGNHHVLFSYLLILNIGMVVLSYFRKWRLINICSYALTVITYMVWLFSKVVNVHDAPYIAALVYASAFYLVFFVMHIIFNLKEKHPFKAAELITLVSNSFFFYTAGMWILHAAGLSQYQGLFTIALAVKNFAFVFPMYKNQKIDKNFIYTLIAFVLVFTSLAAPIQLEGNHITLFWAVEAVALLWLGQKSGLKLIKGVSAIMFVLMGISLGLDWMDVYTGRHTDPMSILFNRGFITGIWCLAALQAGAYLLKPFTEEKFMWGIGVKPIRAVLQYGLLILGYLVGLMECSYQARHLLPQAHAVLMLMYYLLFIGTIITLNNGKRHPINYIATALGVILTFGYLLTDAGQVTDLRNAYLLGTESFLPFALHYINLALMVAMVYLLMLNTQKLAGMRSAFGSLAMWGLAVVLLFIGSTELNHHVLLLRHQPGFDIAHLATQTHKVGYPIMWGLLSFAFMWIGMNKKLLMARIISLSIFFVTLVKLFAYDIQGISEAGKIAAFVCLGIMLLVVSFMYQKLKGLLFENDNTPKTTPS